MIDPKLFDVGKNLQWRDEKSLMMSQPRMVDTMIVWGFLEVADFAPKIPCIHEKLEIIFEII